jgi:hypothetical protein
VNVRLLAVPVLSLSLLALPSASAESSAPVGDTVQSYAGAFQAPTRFIDGESGFPGAGRKVYLVAQAADGVIADVFEVDPRAAGGTFTLGSVKDLTGAGNLDVFFYADLASAADGTPVTTGEFATADKGEQGFVPAGTRYAVVFSPDAVQPTFSFTAQQRPVVGLSALDGVTVPVGSTLGLRNDSAVYASLKHVVASGKPLVDRSAPGNGLVAGEVVDVVFAKVGSYVFETAAGRSTVTVTS